MTPCVSSQTFDIALVGFLIGIAGVVAITFAVDIAVKAARKYKAAAIGERLLEACNGDAITVDLVIADAELGQRIIDDEMARGLRYRLRLARFNEDTQ